MPVLSWRKALLDVVFYHTTHDLAELEFDSIKPMIVCPSPLVADGLRRLMPGGLEIITISKWVSDYLKSLNKKKSNKAELMLRLSSAWRHYFPETDIQIFLRAFEIFTDLRSFSLNLDLLSEFLKETDPQITKSVLIFWAFVTNEDIVDEHKSYQLMGSVIIEKPLWFVGFKHLSGIQIDMLKELGEKTEVNVFFPKDVYAESIHTDWIRWIVPEFQVAPEAGDKKARIVYYPKNKLNYVLDSVKKSVPDSDITLASSQPEFNSRQEVLSAGQFFKSPEDLFSMKRDLIFEEMIDQKVAMTLEEFKNKIILKKKTALQSEDFIDYKVYTLINEALELYGEFQSHIDEFSLKILKLIIELNSPRVSLASLTMISHSRFFELNELPFRDSENSLLIVASESYGSLKSGEGNYSEKMIEALKAIAPIKRSGLDFSWLKNDLRIFLNNPKNILLMEEDLEKTDLAWREILKDFDIEVMSPEIQFQLKDRKDYISERMKTGPFSVKNFSASRLQSFLDCPRKYYFSYVEKLEHRPEERLEVGSDEKGTLEHAIIQNYFEKAGYQKEFDTLLHKNICKRELETFIAKNSLKLNEQNKLSTFFEILNYSQSGIEYLLNFCRENKAQEIKFEVELRHNEWELAGSIDCLVLLPDSRAGVFDFKRSYAAIGSKGETQKFEKIQIWVYLLYLLRQEKLNVQQWGYINLSEIEKSLIFNEAKEVSLEEITVDNFQALLIETENRIKAEVKFLPAPSEKDICKFCEVKLFCSRGSLA